MRRMTMMTWNSRLNSGMFRIWVSCYY
ncbi:hypothetical protein LINPERPRIM_LOCUS32782 [Linum perenne]